jgi:serine/threonine protein kinase/TPR repeat protein
MRTGERVAVTRSGVTAVELRKLLQRALGPGYELGARVGAGGFAEVFRAQDLRLKRSVAVKVLRPDLGLSPGMLERFQREAETIAALRHPNIVPIFDVGEAHGVAYLIMPFIEGESLRARMERDGKLPVPEVRRILREAAHGLAAAHDAGVIHRDVKPENIMLEGRDARILLMDFGIAKAVGGDEETPVTEEGIAPALTSTGIIVGTPQYMSPEQACGDKTIDARTDQYSLGVVGYRLLSGGLPFEGESTRAVLYKQLVSEPPPIMEKVPDAPPGLASAITRAMRKEPRERFDTMTEFARMVEDEQLSLTAAGMTAIAAPGGKTAKSPKPAKIKSASASRNRLLMIGGGIAAVALIAVAGITLSGGSVSDAFQPISAIGGLDAPADDSVSGAGNNIPAPTTTLPQAPVTNTRRPGTPPPPAPTGARGTTGRPATTPGTTSATPPAAPRVTCASLINASDWTGALPLCTTAAEAGEVVAMRHLAGMYDRGDGVPADPAQAFNWYRRASPNDAESKFQLSRMYEIGRGTPRDARANVSTLREAAAMGHLQAILTLATRLENGAGMGRDYNESALWYTKAATAGSAQAMLKLADWARRGRGMTRDEALAVQYFRQAGDAGNADGAWEAARAYLEGRGVAADEATGMTLLRQAARLGNASAVEELQRRGG